MLVIRIDTYGFTAALLEYLEHWICLAASIPSCILVQANLEVHQFVLDSKKGG